MTSVAMFGNGRTAVTVAVNRPSATSAVEHSPSTSASLVPRASAAPAPSWATSSAFAAAPPDGADSPNCEAGDHSLLLDSRDYWLDVIQERRPREAKCRCGGKAFEVVLDYSFRDGTRVVRSVGVSGRCCACATERRLADFEIDYEPTDTLVSTPLDPCEVPWVKPKRISLTALWTPGDLDRFVSHATRAEEAVLYFAGRQEKPRRCTGEQLSVLLREARTFDVLLTNVEIPLPDQLCRSSELVRMCQSGRSKAHLRPCMRKKSRNWEGQLRRHKEPRTSHRLREIRSHGLARYPMAPNRWSRTLRRASPDRKPCRQPRH